MSVKPAFPILSQSVSQNDCSETEIAVLYLNSVCSIDCVLLRRFSESRIGAETTEEENKHSRKRRRDQDKLQPS